MPVKKERLVNGVVWTVTVTQQHAPKQWSRDLKPNVLLLWKRFSENGDSFATLAVNFE